MNAIKNFFKKQPRVTWIIFVVFCILFILIPLLYSVSSYNHHFPDISKIDLIQSIEVEYTEYNINTGLYEQIWYAPIISVVMPVLMFPAFLINFLISTITILIIGPLLMLGIASINPDKFILHQSIFSYFVVIIEVYFIATLISKIWYIIKNKRADRKLPTTNY